MFSRTISVLMISIVEFLERFSYYGIRSIAVLYIMQESGFAFDQVTVFEYYGLFTMFIGLMAIPAGLISDFLLKQRSGVKIGLLFIFLGYVSLLGPNKFMFIAGLLLVILGSGFVKPNIMVSMGRLYKKSDRKRNIGFTFFYLAINLGAFLTTILIPFVYTELGWSIPVIICALSTLLALILFTLTSNKFEFIETDHENLTEKPKTDADSEILDSKLVPDSFSVDATRLGSLFLAFLAIGFVTIYWLVYELSAESLYSSINGLDLNLFGFPLSPTFFQFVPTLLLIFLCGLFAGLWYWKGSGNTWIKMGIGLFLMSAAAFLYHQGGQLFSDQSISFFIFGSVLMTFSEIFVSIFGLSAITRFTPINYSSTITGLYIAIAANIGAIVNLIGVGNSQYFKLPFIILIALLGIGALIFRKQLSRLGWGVS